MKTLVFSDTHLTHKFKHEKFNQLYELLDQDWDEIVINGDFWDSYSTSFDRFINSQWSKLFPLLQNRAIYIYGNHDAKKKSDNRRALFSKEAHEQYTIHKDDKTYLFIHGHQFAPTLDVKYPFISNVIINGITMKYFELGCRIQKADFFQKPFFKKYNNQQMKYQKQNLSPNTVLVCGHSHAYQNDGNNYMNSGFIDFGEVNYLRLDI